MILIHQFTQGAFYHETDLQNREIVVNLCLGLGFLLLVLLGACNPITKPTPRTQLTSGVYL
ncbi:MAG: hypothetical protein R2865_12320 [Deinococcales bacterium]